MTAIITGGSGAIGSMCAYEAARLNYDIILVCNKNPDKADGVREMLKDFDVKIVCVQADLTTADGRMRVYAEAKQAGGADILINNAGIAQIKPFLDTNDSETSRMIGTDLSAAIDLTRLIIPQMLRKRAGAIVNISSVWGVSGASCEVLYSSAKAGIIGFTKSLAKELAPDGITVNCVAPGCIESPMLDGLDRKELAGKIPMGRIGNGLEVAKAVMFLARHGYITGQVLTVDGGMTV